MLKKESEKVREITFRPFSRKCKEESEKLHEITLRPFSPKASREFNMGAISTTEICDLSCSFCQFNGPKASKKTRQLPPELVIKALRDVPKGEQVYFSGTGEFFLDPNAIDYLAAAIDLGLVPLVLSHGQLFTPELLCKLLEIGVRHFRMSCDAIEPKAYAKIRRGGELRKILEAAAFLREKKTLHPDITVEINCTLLVNSFIKQQEIIEFWRTKVDAVNFNAEYFDTFRYRNIHFVPDERVDCTLQTYVLPSGKIAPCCAMIVYEHDNDVSWLPDIRTHTLQEAHDQLSKMYEDPESTLSSLCRKCDWWIMWTTQNSITPYLRCVPLNETIAEESKSPPPDTVKNQPPPSRNLLSKLRSTIRRGK